MVRRAPHGPGPDQDPEVHFLLETAPPLLLPQQTWANEHMPDVMGALLPRSRNLLQGQEGGRWRGGPDVCPREMPPVKPPFW